jgi:hypothetical protein
MIRFLVAILACALLIGCQPTGRPVAKVTGTVTLQGKPVPAGIVIFQSEDGLQNVMANIDKQGRFSLKTHDAGGIAPGKYKVAIKPPPQNYETPPLADAAINDPRPLDTTIPRKYYAVESSGLTAAVKLDQANDLKFDLQP